MTYTTAVVHIDHHSADILAFDTEDFVASHVHEHTHPTRQHHSGVRTEHAFFADVCQKLSAYREILVTGSHGGLAAFRHYVEKHRPVLFHRIVGWEVSDHQSNGQLLAFARVYIYSHRRMAAAAS